MKHYFIINPIAGRLDSSHSLETKLEEMFRDRLDTYQTYVTKGPNEATIEIKRWCEKNESSPHPEEVTFYICGGDGTCFEAVNGLMGYPHARMTIVPIGSCNDFLKNFPQYDFMNLEALIQGTEIKIDVLKVNDRYTLNVANIGYDARVNYDCVRFRSRFKTVKKAYTYAIVRNLLKPLGDQVMIKSENKVLYHNKALLMAFANGSYYGGGFHCAPKAKYDDGLLDMVVVKKVGIFRFARLVKYYKRGEHLEGDRFKKLVTFHQLKKVTIESENELCLCLDGETFHMKKVTVELVPQAIRFVVPSLKKVK